MQGRDLKEMIERAFNSALAMADEGVGPGKVHANRSANWVRGLAREFERRYMSPGGMQVFYHGKDGDWGELLYDIHVCTMGTTASPQNKVEISHITSSLWAIESELDNDAREWAWDFQKLIASGAEYKLYVGSFAHDIERQLKFLESMAEHCTGEIYIALIPHPEEWTNVRGEQNAVLYAYNGEDYTWELID